MDFADILTNYGNPFYTIHRAHLQAATLAGCMATGLVDLQLGKSVSEVDFDGTRVLVVPSKEPSATGVWYEADVILASDGIKSVTRTGLLNRLGEVDEVVDTGQGAYRILLSRDQLKHDPELLELVEGKVSYRWIGERRHIIACTFRPLNIFNCFVLMIIDTSHLLQILSLPTQFSICRQHIPTLISLMLFLQLTQLEGARVNY